MEVMVTTAAIRRTKLQSSRHCQQTNTQLFTGWMPFLPPNQQCQSTEGQKAKAQLYCINSAFQCAIGNSMFKIRFCSKHDR